jgi:hypothetical protein
VENVCERLVIDDNRPVLQVVKEVVVHRIAEERPERIVAECPQGRERLVVTEGARGQDGESAPLEVVTHEEIVSGMAVRLRSSTGKASPAQANSINTADVFGIALNSIGPDHTLLVTRDRVIKADWTAIIGSVSLTPGLSYFLSPTVPGGLQTTPPETAGHVVCLVGEAISPTTLAVQFGIPILL